MKKDISALIQAIPGFLNVVAFLLFIFILFAILGLYQYAGIFDNKCRTTPLPVNSTYWPTDPSLPDRVCT